MTSFITNKEMEASAILRPETPWQLRLSPGVARARERLLRVWIDAFLVLFCHMQVFFLIKGLQRTKKFQLYLRTVKNRYNMWLDN